MGPTRSRRILRGLSTALLALALALFLFWLMLPRLLGVAAERWLNVPGLHDLHVDVLQVDDVHARLRELRAVYASPGGQRFQFTLHDIELVYSLTDRHVEQLRVSRGDLVVFTAAASGASPWPRLEIPQIPLGDLQVGLLHVSIQSPQGPALQAQGSVHVWQKDGVVQLEFKPDQDRLRITATPHKAAEHRLEVRAEWQPAVGPPAQAELLIGTQPDQQAARLVAQAPLPLLADLAHHFGLAVPLGPTRGTLALTAQAQFGKNTGDIASVSGEARFTKAGGQLKFAGAPDQPTFELDGKLQFARQGSGTQLHGQPGLAWQLNRQGSQPLQASGQLDQPLAVRLDTGGVTTEGKLPFALSSPKWGNWSGALQSVRLQRANAASAWSAGDAQLQFKGLLKEWQQEAMQLRDLQASGDATLSWSPSTGLRSDLKAQANIGKLSRSGDAPVSVTNSSWQLTAKADARAGSSFWNSLSVQGEASSPQLKIETATEALLALGPVLLHLSPFRPADPQPKLDALIAVKAIQYAALPSPDLNAHLQLKDGELSTDGSLLFQGIEVLRFTGSHTLARACGEAKATMAQPLATLDKLLRPRPPALMPLDLAAGDADGRLAVNWCSGRTARFDVQGTLHLRDTTLTWDKARIEKLQASLTLDGVQPLQGRVQLSAPHAELAAGTSLADLNTDIALAPQELSIRALDFKMLGGAVHSEPARLPWPLTTPTLPLAIRQMDLGQLLELLKVEGLSGSGQLDGVLPLTYRDGGLEIDNGLLSSHGAGTLKYAPEQTMPENLGLQVLRNFHFEQLRANIWYAGSGAYRTQIKLEGSNPDVYSGYPILFGLNVNGELPDMFRAAIFSGDFNRHILEQLQSGKMQ